MSPSRVTSGACTGLSMSSTATASVTHAQYPAADAAASPSNTTTTSANLRVGLRATLEKDLNDFAGDAGLVEGFSVRVEFGAVQQVVPTVAEEGGFDLVCMASQSSGSFLGSTVDAVLRNTKLPMLVVYVPA